MTREELIMAFTMRLDGATFEEIGNKFGVTRQAIMYNFDSVVHRGRDKKTDIAISKIVYPNIARYIKDAQITMGKFIEMLGYSSSKANVANALYGKRNMSAKMICGIVKTTGMTYKEVVERSDGNGD